MPLQGKYDDSPNATNVFQWGSQGLKIENYKSKGKKLIIAPATKHTHTFIFLHGRNRDGLHPASDLLTSKTSKKENFVRYFPTFRWVFPSAERCLSIRTFRERRQWFDIWSTKRPDQCSGLETAGLRDSLATIVELIREEAEVDAIGYEHIILGGIDQGAAVAIWCLMAMGVKLGGLVSVGGYMPFSSDVLKIARLPPRRRTTQIQNKVWNDWGNEAAKAEFSGYANMKYYLKSHSLLFDLTALGSEHDVKKNLSLQTPVFIYHCEDDNIVPLKSSVKLMECLKKMGFTCYCTGHVEGGHWFNKPGGIDDVVVFLDFVTAMKGEHKQKGVANQQKNTGGVEKTAADRIT